MPGTISSFVKKCVGMINGFVNHGCSCLIDKFLAKQRRAFER